MQLDKLQLKGCIPDSVLRAPAGHSFCTREQLYRRKDTLLRALMSGQQLLHRAAVHVKGHRDFFGGGEGCFSRWLVGLV